MARYSKSPPEGTLTTLHSFDGSDGIGPSDGLIQARDGNLYGTTYFGGLGDGGTAFKITPTGQLTTLHSFDQYRDGSGIVAPVVQASDGNFYGTTSRGGHYDGGTVFQMSPDGTLGWVYYFGLGSAPTAGLVQAGDGNLYGTTSNLNAGYGTIFKISPEGTLTTLHDFNGRDGTYPYAGLVLASDGNFYGTTVLGGAYGDGTVYRFGVARACATCRP